MIEFIRIDDRFVHAQIVWGWAPILMPDEIIVANDKVAQDELRKKILIAAALDRFIIKILSLKETAATLKSDEKKRLLLLVSKPADVAFLIENGVPVKNVSLGWMSLSAEKKQIYETVYVDDEDIRAFRKLINMGVDVKYQASPSSVPFNVDFKQLLCHKKL